MKYKIGDKFLHNKQTLTISAIAGSKYYVKIGCCRRILVSESELDSMTKLTENSSE